MENRIETSLPFFQFTVDMLECIIDNNLSANQIAVYALLELNKDIARGKTHKLPIEYLAESIKVSESTVYRAIARLKECELFLPTDWGYIIGHLPYAELAKNTAKQAKADKPKRAFYLELRRRITAATEETGEELNKNNILKLFLALCAEKKDAAEYYPKQQSGLHDDLAKFAPYS